MSESDPEIAALATLIKILEPLTNEQRVRVLGFVFHKLNIRMSDSRERQIGHDFDLASALGTQLDGKPTHAEGPAAATDIRSLKETKKPRTANEMAALVAYYLEHVASGDERRSFITAEDIKTYFNQAGFPLPTAPAAMTLTHAKNAGYLTARDRGQYRLNPVGYNLIAYKLPVDGFEERKSVSRSHKKLAAKRSRRKTGARK
jgi:hypothetical protein